MAILEQGADRWRDPCAYIKKQHDMIGRYGTLSGVDLDLRPETRPLSRSKEPWISMHGAARTCDDDAGGDWTSFWMNQCHPFLLVRYPFALY